MIRRLTTSLLAPLVAIVLALVLTVLVLLFSGSSVSGFVSTLFTPPSGTNVSNVLNNASVLYLSGLAAAVGFRMNLFNIGVEGQYRVGVFAAAWLAGSGILPGPLATIAAVLLAAVAGALWALIAGVLKVTRGVSEVISTIMLNAIAVSITAYLLRKVGVVKGNILLTKEVPAGSQVPGIPLIPDAPGVYGLALLAVLAGVLYWLVLNRSVFGFELRATGASPSAAAASGVDVRRMVLVSMVISGGIAGLVGLPILFGQTYAFSTSFQAGLGFTGIAVALLGRNNAVGIAFGALLFSYLSEKSITLELNAGVSDKIVMITQGVIVMSVVIAYELVRRFATAREQREVAAELAHGELEEAPR